MEKIVLPRCEVCRGLGIFTFYTFSDLGFWFCTRRCKCIWLINEIKRLIGIWDLIHLESINFYLEKLREELKNLEV